LIKIVIFLVWVSCHADDGYNELVLMD
jgi:hypothetical protein